MQHPYGWLSLAPPIVAIVLAIATRQVVLSLVCGIFAGAMIMSGGDPFTAVYHTWETHLWQTFVDGGKLRVFSFTILMGAMIGVITNSGGMRGLIDIVTPFASNRRRGQLATWLMGLLIFFDDYANTMLIGNTLRPICDRLRISREKLAYLVDSTAAPVAGLAPLSTWVAVEIDYIGSGLTAIPNDGLSAFGLFLSSIPYRFYIWSALLLVPITAWLGRDLGPMVAAEQRAVASDGKASVSQAELAVHSSWINAVLPILLTLAVVMYFIYATGKAGTEAVGNTALRDVLGAADSSLALQYGALAGLAAAFVLPWATRVEKASLLFKGALDGAKVVLPAVAILWTASAMSNMTTNESVDGVSTTTPYEFRDHRLYTADFLTQVLLSESETGELTPRIGATYLPTLVFVLAGAVAFCTGTSWGTMGILMPLVIQTAHTILSSNDLPLQPSNAIFLASIAGVLAGAVFGDHCSPISDTTVLSSQASGCDHLGHVTTQLPYAALAAMVSIALGTIPIGFGVSVWVLAPLQLLALFVAMRVLGRVPAAPA